MKTKNRILLPLATLAGIALAAGSANAATLVADFTNDSPLVRTAAFDPGLTNLNTTGWLQDTTNSGISHDFKYDISSYSFGTATQLWVTASTSNGTSTMRPAAGNGIAVNGGGNDNWWDPTDAVNLNFVVSILNASSTDITASFLSSYTIDLTGVAMRWELGAAARFAGQAVTSNVGSVGAAGLQGVSLTTGQTAETSFTFDQRTGNNIAQIQQLRFEIVPEPSSAALLGLAGAALLLRRRRH